jgi:hypothetical protein
MSDSESAARWAGGVFTTADLGDVRRNRRLVLMATRAARRPSGKVSDVFDKAHEREGAYDFLENDAIPASAIAKMLFAASVAHAPNGRLVYVVVDGSSLTFTDTNESKDIGPIGSPNRAARGVQVMSALGVSTDGVPLGLLDQLVWTRPPRVKRTPTEAYERNLKRPFNDKETSKFVDAARNAAARLAEAGKLAWVVIDREADNRDILFGLAKTECLYTVRSNWDRPTLGEDGLRGPKLRELLRAQPLLGYYTIEIGRTGRRAARSATVGIRAAPVELLFRKRDPKPKKSMRVWAVRLREHTTDPNPLEWLLFTNAPVTNEEQAKRVVESYCMRWRIEEFHRTWKQGDCNVEDAQLHSLDALTKWATILAAVATRIERLKYLSRKMPEQPATIELGEDEIEALKLDQRRRRPAQKRKRLPATPTIEEAARWVAELGGWIGPANGPPGSMTLARGMRRLADLVDAIRLVRQPTEAIEGVRRT